MPDTTAAHSSTMRIQFAADIGTDARRHVARLLEGWDGALFRAPVTVAQLPGGANNQNYVVTAGARRYALRIANQDNERMAVDRDSARRAQDDAAALGVAPTVLAHCGAEGHLLSAFVDGVALSVATVDDPSVLSAIADTFRALHQGESKCRNFDPFADIEMWINQAAESGAVLPEDLEELRRRAITVRDTLDSLGLPKVFCHNDTVPQNFIWDGDRVILVDWDYAGHYYAAFELGSFICTADLTDARAEAFLRSYEPDLDNASRARVRLMQFVAGLREIAWVLNATTMLRGTTMVADAFYDDYLTNNVRRTRNFGLADDFSDLLAAAAVRGHSTTI